MTSFLQLVFLLIIILLTAKAAGYLATRLGQPSVLGELLIGIVLGPSLLNLGHLPLITDAHLTENIIHLGEIGVLLLMFIAGVELHFRELTQNVRVSAFAGVLGVILPVLLGFFVGEMFGLHLNSSIFLGLTLGATSVSISAQTLMEMKALRSRVGLGLLGSAVFDDVLVILLLSGFLALESGGSLGQVLMVLVRMIVYFGLSALVGLRLLPWVARKVSKLGISQGLLSLAVVVMLIYGLAAEVVGGMAAITGTFLAGLMFSRTPEKSQFETGLRSLSYSFFVPIFFVSIGLQVNLREVSSSAIWLSLVVVIAAIFGKIIGAGVGARLGKFSTREALQLGIGMVSRGEVGLIVGNAGLRAGLISPDAFSAVIATVLISTLITPPLLRASFNKKPTRKVASENEPTESHQTPEEAK